MFGNRNKSPVYRSSPMPSYESSPPPYFNGNISYPNHYQQDGSQLVQYHPEQSSTSIQTSSSAQQLAQRTQIGGNDVVLYLNNKQITLSQASISSFCTDYVCRTLARSTALNCRVLDKLAKENKISIRHRETMTGNIIKQKFASSAPNAGLSAGLIAALGDFSHFTDIIEEFFSYTYTDAVKRNESYSTHYYANDQYTITGCFLQRRVYKRTNGFKLALVSNKYTDTQFETACYLFTFKVAQAAKFMESYLYGSQ
ncbi:hypothetical protein K501DRAFT_279903 [Backusella circina FSU 941]|nr:hypothetical protein K501DRAFT_279903 [Backusella circina FSU 941]